MKNSVKKNNENLLIDIYKEFNFWPNKIQSLG